MTTAEGLRAQGLAERVSLTLSKTDIHWRRLYAETESKADNSYRRLIDIFETNPPSLCEADLTPREQISDIIRRFISGKELIFDSEYHALWPGEAAIWELKTADLRLFGFFTDFNEYMIVGVDFKDKIVEHDLANGYRASAVRFREKHSVKCLMKSGEHDVFSVRS